MPENTAKVDRTTRFGNPFHMLKRVTSVSIFANTAIGIWSPMQIDELVRPSIRDAVYEVHRQWLRRLGQHPCEAIRSALRGKNLGCWCPLEVKCHADVLLEIANR